MILRTERLNKVSCLSTEQDKPLETGPYGFILLECPCVWDKVGADGTGRVLLAAWSRVLEMIDIRC